MEQHTDVHIIVVDDQRLVREGFKKLLELTDPHILVDAVCAHGAEALQTLANMEAQRQIPDIALLDIQMPVMDGIAATQHITERWPQIKIILLTTFDADDLILAGLRAGAAGYLLKDSAPDDLVAAIYAVYHGETSLQPAIAAKVVRRALQNSAPARAETTAPNELTEREKDILRWLGKGASNREMSETLFITEGTVKNHVSNILAKLGLRDRTQAALYAREHGI